MAEPSTSSVKCQSVLVEWVGTHGSGNETRHLCHGKPATSREVKLEIYFDPVSSFCFFKLRATVDLGGQIMPLFLYIKPDHITSLIYTGSKGTTNTMPHLRFTLSEPADLVVPLGDSLPLKRPRLDGSTLTSLKQLAQETTLCVYMAHDQILSERLLQPLCAAVTDRSLKPLNMHSGLSGLYRGRGAKILQGAELGFPPALPSYNKIGVSPAPYPSKRSMFELSLFFLALLT